MKDCWRLLNKWYYLRKKKTWLLSEWHVYYTLLIGNNVYLIKACHLQWVTFRVFFTHADRSCRGMVSLAFVCLFFCMICSVRPFIHTIYQKPMPLGSPNLTNKCSTMNPGNPFIFGSEVKVTKKQCRRGSLHSCECWLLPVSLLQSFSDVVFNNILQNFIIIVTSQMPGCANEWSCAWN